MTSVLVEAWVLRGTMPPRKVLGTVKRCEHSDWLIVDSIVGQKGSYWKGKRCRIGRTAFFTELAATRRWQGNIDKACTDGYRVRFVTPNILELKKQLNVPDVYARKARP